MSESSNDPLGPRDYKLNPGCQRVVLSALALLVLAVFSGLVWVVLRLFGWSL